MPNFNEDTLYGLGRTLTTVASLRNMNIPPPDQVVHRGAYNYYVRADGSRVGDGSMVVEWIWDVLSRKHIATLIDFLDGAEFANVYVHTDVRDGVLPLPETAFATFYATMWKPVLSGDDGIGVATSPYTMQTVKLTFVNLVEIGDYL